MHNLSSRRLRRFSARSVFATLSFGFAVTIGLHSAHAAELDPAQIMSTKGCAACHIIPGVVGAKGKMGPSLKGIGKRKRMVARTLTNNDKNMRRWLKNPKAVKSDTMMPNVGLSDEEVETLVKHFHTL